MCSSICSFVIFWLVIEVSSRLAFDLAERLATVVAFLVRGFPKSFVVRQTVHALFVGAYITGWIDVVLTKFNSDGNYVRATTWGERHDDFGFGLSIDNVGNVFVTGNFDDRSEMDLEPGDGEDWHMSNGVEDIYLVKFLPNGFWE